MKLNKKMIIPAFTLLAGASIAGSVTGTVAWYQYSTRTNVSYVGTSAGAIGNLQLRIKGIGDFGPQLNIKDVETYLNSQEIGTEVEPVTPGALGKNDALKQKAWKEFSSDIEVLNINPDGDLGKAYCFNSTTNKLFKYENDQWSEVEGITVAASDPALGSFAVGKQYYNSNSNKLFEVELAKKNFYVNPQYGVGPYENWIKATQKNFVRLPLEFRFIGNTEEDLLAKDVYLSDLKIQKDSVRDNDAANHGDISDAIRVHFSSYADGDEEHAVNHLVSQNGGSTLTHGRLKIGRGSDFDQGYTGDIYGFDGSPYGYINYGGTEGQQTSYKNSSASEASDGYIYEEEADASGWILQDMPSGASDPLDSQGKEGDFFWNANESKVLRKGATAWEEFTDYDSGVDAPGLSTVATHEYYLHTGNSKLYLRGFAKESVYPLLVKNDAENPIKIDESSISADKKIGSTIAKAVDPAEQKYLNVDVTIWVEGWHKFEYNNKFTSIWDADLIGSYFDVGMQFAVQAE